MHLEASQLSPKIVKATLTFCQWVFLFAVVFSFYTFINTGLIIDLVSSILFFRFCISAYQLKVVYDTCVVREYLESVKREAIFMKGLGRKTRRKIGFSTKSNLKSIVLENDLQS
jgi:hypothetical protein